jgi:hypothetical protein
MTIAELIKCLKTMPQNATVMVQVDNDGTLADSNRVALYGTYAMTGQPGQEFIVIEPK